jgi:hypothetical protein
MIPVTSPSQVVVAVHGTNKRAWERICESDRIILERLSAKFGPYRKPLRVYHECHGNMSISRKVSLVLE